MGFSGKAAFAYFLNEVCAGFFHAGCVCHEVLDEAGGLAREDAKHVVEYEHLTVAVQTGADADGCHGVEAGGDFGGKGGWNQFQHNHCGTSLFEREGVAVHPDCAGFVAALDAITAELMNGLWSESDMGANRHAAFDQKTNRVGKMFAPLELDHLSAGGHQLDGVAHGLFGAFLVAAEWHVGEDESAVAAACDAFGVIDRLFDGHRQSGFLTLNDVSERVTDEHGVDAATVHDRSETGVVGGKHGDFAAFGTHFGEFEQGDGFVVLEIVHGVQILVKVRGWDRVAVSRGVLSSVVKKLAETAHRAQTLKQQVEIIVEVDRVKHLGLDDEDRSRIVLVKKAGVAFCHAFEIRFGDAFFGQQTTLPYASDQGFRPRLKIEHQIGAARYGGRHYVVNALIECELLRRQVECGK